MKHRKVQINWITKFSLLTIITAFALLLSHSAAEATKIYWTDEGTQKIQRANSDGTDVQNFVTTGLLYPRGIVIDPVDEKIYWADYGMQTIHRANLDGTDVQNVVWGEIYPVGIAIDDTDRKIYWTDPGNGAILRADLDGTNAEYLVTGLSGPQDIAVDVVEGWIYWTDLLLIYRAYLDGSNVQYFAPMHASSLMGITIDAVGRKIYWTDYNTGVIQRANMDGTDIEDLVTGLNGPGGIALDLGNGKMYWTSYNTGKIQRANMDGTDVEDIVTGLSKPTFVALDLSPDREPSITVTPSPIAFGDVTVGIAKQITLSIGNDGDADLNVTDITSNLGEILHFVQDDITVAPDATHNITLTLTASAVGVIDGTLTIISNDLNSPTSIGITATAQSPLASDGSGTATVSPGSVQTRSTGNALIFTFTAEGKIDGGSISMEVPAGWTQPTSGNININSTGTTGAMIYDANTVTVPITTLATGGTITITYSNITAPSTPGDATFIFKSRGTASGTLTEIANQPVVAVVAMPSINVEPDTIDFGTVILGQASERIISIGNDGDADLTVTNITSDVIGLAISSTSFMVAVGTDARDITLTLTASTEGAINGKLTIISNDPNSPTKIDISGNAITSGIIAGITNPTPNSYHGGTLEIRGTAKVVGSASLLNWQLYYAPGDQTQSPDSVKPLAVGTWTRLIKSTDPVDDDALFSWNTTTLDQTAREGDLYTLRLWVDTVSEREEKMIVFTVDNVKPEKPTIELTSQSGGSEFIKNNDTIEVAGTVEETWLEMVGILLKIGAQQTEQLTEPIPIDGTSFSMNFDVAEVSGPVRVAVTVRDKAGNTSDPKNSNSLLTDNGKPVVIIQQPAYGANFQTTPIGISGVASDSGSGVAEVEIKFGTDDWKRISGTTNWTHQYDPKVEFPERENSECEFWVRAYDSVGNVSDGVRDWVQFYFDDPACNISQPIDGETLSGNVEIRGSANDKNTEDETFVLEYAEGEDAPDGANWIAIDAFAPPITDGVMAIWDTSKLEGAYTLRLRVTGTSFTITVRRKNLHIFSEQIGDVNDDGVVDAKDAKAILRHVVGLPPAGQFIVNRADVSENGSITAYDAALIFQKVAGLIEEF